MKKKNDSYEWMIRYIKYLVFKRKFIQEIQEKERKMKMMKAIIRMFLVITTICFLVSCGGSIPDEKNTDESKLTLARFKVSLSNTGNEAEIKFEALKENNVQREKIEGVKTVILTITGQGLDPIKVALAESTSGYYESEVYLPVDIKLTLEVEVEDDNGNVVFKGQDTVTLEADKPASLNVSLKGVDIDCLVPIIMSVSTTDKVIIPGQKATISVVVQDDSEELSYVISHNAAKGSLSNESGLVSMENGEGIIETVLTADTQGDYVDVVTIEAINECGSITARMSIKVTPEGSIFVNLPPLIKLLAVKDNGETVNVEVEVIDENNDSLVFSWVGESELEFVGNTNSDSVVIKKPLNQTFAVLTVTDEFGAESSIRFNVQGALLIIPSAPANVSIDGASITWGNVVSADSYNIYQSTTPGVNKDNGTKITDVTSPYKLSVDNGVTYYYVVTAVNGAGESAESAEVDIMICADIEVPNSPYPSDKTGLDTSVNLSWSDCQNADSYDVYLGLSPDTAYHANSINNNCSLSGLAYDTTYYWKVVAKSNCGEVSSVVWNFTIMKAPLPASPENVRVALGEDKSSAIITWNDVSSADLYNIYELDKPGVKVNNYLDIFRNASSPCTISSFDYNKTYYFVVTSKNDNGESVESAEVSVKIPFDQDCFANDDLESLKVEPANDEVITEEKSCFGKWTIKSITLARNWEEIILFSPAYSPDLWPGVIVSMKSMLAGVPESVFVQRAPLTISIKGLTFLTDNIRIIEEDPHSGTIEQAINEMLVAGLGEATNAAFVTVEIVEAHSRKQLAIEGGLEIVFDDDNQMTSGFNFSNLEESRSIFVKIVQRYYNVNIKIQKSGADYLAEGVSCAEVYDTLDEDDIPLLVSSIMYGRILIYQMSNSKSVTKEKLTAAFKAKVSDFQVGGHISSELEEIFDSSEIRLLMLGGNVDAVAKIIKNEDARAFFEDGLRWGADSPGVPLIYTLRSMSKGMPIFSYGNMTTFQIKTFQYAQGDNSYFLKWGACDNGDENNYKLNRDGSGGCGDCWHIEETIGDNLNLHYPQDAQIYGETWLYVEEATNLTGLAMGGDVGFIWLNGVEIKGSQLSLKKGWNHLEFTAYNQNQGVDFRISALADSVLIMDSEGCN